MIEILRGVHFPVGAPRPGRMHEGHPPGGPAVPELMASATAHELWSPLTVRGRGTVTTEDGTVTIDGQHVVRPKHRVGYAVFDVDCAPISFDPAGPIRVVLGPDLPGVDLSGPFRIGPLGNRVGIRLEGPPVAAPARGPSAPMVRGAIQVPPSGELIVLGPDHPTTGGYPVVAVVCRADWGRLFARRPGAPVELVPISAEAARQLRG